MLELHLSDKIYVIVMDLSHFDQIGITMASSISVLENMIADGKVLIYQNHIVVIVSQAEKASVDMKLTDLETFLMNKPIIVGISRKFKHLDEIQKHYNQAVRALELGCILNNGKQIIQYDDIAIFHMFEIYSKNELRDFCHPAVIALMEFDIKHKSCYTQTLFSYITMAQKKLGSANSLHVHRNTVNYRIQKIQEITGMDLADNNFFQDCYLSMKILEYTRDIQIVNDQCIINYGQDLSESKR
ncbi:MAG: helix-turn-helix domain-containing protein [Clostridiales bacterium]|nr:helix-turn-helix domain-containing protein [Clostridiales bacterium]